MAKNSNNGNIKLLTYILILLFAIVAATIIPIAIIKFPIWFSPDPTPTLISTQTPTQTNTPTETYTPSPTFTPTLTPTTTYTPTPTPDLRIIKDDPKKFLLESDDLPPEAGYFIPRSDWMSPHHNSEIIDGWGREKGMEYLEKTGRIDGWFVQFSRGSDTVRAPLIIYHNIIQYETIEGANITVEEYNRAKRDLAGSLDWEEVKRTPKVEGQLNLSFLYKELDSSGKYVVWYCVESQYQNYVSILCGSGFEEDVQYDYVEEIANIAIEKLKSAKVFSP